jgi:hypothetical protein
VPFGVLIYLPETAINRGTDMGNRVDIFPTKFVELNIEGKEGAASYGLRVCDDNGGTYSNAFVREDIVGKTPLEIVELARGIDEISRDLIDFAEQEKDGISIAGDFYPWTALKPDTAKP